MAKAVVIATQSGNGPRQTHAGTTGGDPSEGSGPSGDRPRVGKRIEEALRGRLGEERYAVWFGDAVTIDVEDGDAGGSRSVVIGVGNAFSQEWMKRTFQADLEAAVEAACGAGWSIVWRTAAVTAIATVPAVPPAQGLIRPVAADRPPSRAISAMTEA